MAGKPNAVYEPERVRGKLDSIDITEAKRVAQILGKEKGLFPDKKADPADDPADDPAFLLRTSYGERVKMDRYAAQFEFEIKNSIQAFASFISFFSEPVDYVNPRFVNYRMSVYYNKIAQLVNSTRTLLPRNNARRGEMLKKSSPFFYSVLNTFRSWNVERIGVDLSKIQGHSRAARVSEFADILRAVYKPLFILEKLDMETHIKTAYKLLYKVICIENPTEPKEKNRELIRAALSSYADIRREVRYGLYPLLMKHISDRWFPYERLFTDRRRRFMAFLDLTENYQIKPSDLNLEQTDNKNPEVVEDQHGEEEHYPDDPKEIERKARAAEEETGRRALNHSLNALEMLFPQAGWEKLAEFPDLYPYFADTYDLRRGYELIAPTDPLQQVAVLMHILEDLCVAMRYVSFGTAIPHWRGYIDESFTKEYLSRLGEYCRILEQSVGSGTSPLAKRTLGELHWIKRLYFLPYYKFESVGLPPSQKKDVIPIYSETRNFRKFLTQIAACIEEGNRNGGAAAKAKCRDIENPWQPYNFDVPNPVSKRLDALIAPGNRNNATLIFFTLSAATVLDYLLNDESSWAYNDQTGFIFRSVKGGVTPMFGVEEKLNADQIFKNVMKQKTAERRKS